MNPSNNSLTDLHQQKKQRKRQRQQEQQLQTNGLLYNTTPPMISGQYNHPSVDHQIPLPSLSNIMSTHSVISASLPSSHHNITYPVDGRLPSKHQQIIQRVKDSSIRSDHSRSTPSDATSLPTQIKQESFIYNNNDHQNHHTSGSVYSHHPQTDNTHRQGYNDNKSIGQKQQKFYQVRHPSNTTLTSSKSTNSQMTRAMDNNSLTFYQRSAMDGYPQSSSSHINLGNTANVETLFNPSMQTSHSTSSMQQFVDFNQQKFQQIDDPHKIYSFVPLDVISQQKRPRKKFNEVERVYQCTYLNCTKAYGTLNHLNAHVTMQAHGPKRLPVEFKELRKQLKSNRQKTQNNKASKESPTTQSQTNNSQDNLFTLQQQQQHNCHGYLIDNHNKSSNLNQNNQFLTVTNTAMTSSSNSSDPMIMNQHSYNTYHPDPVHYPRDQSFAQELPRPQIYQQPYHPQQQQQKYTMTQQNDHHQPFQ